MSRMPWLSKNALGDVRTRLIDKKKIRIRATFTKSSSCKEHSVQPLFGTPTRRNNLSDDGWSHPGFSIFGLAFDDGHQLGVISILPALNRTKDNEGKLHIACRCLNGPNGELCQSSHMWTTHKLHDRPTGDAPSVHSARQGHFLAADPRRCYH